MDALGMWFHRMAVMGVGYNSGKCGHTVDLGCSKMVAHLLEIVDHVLYVCLQVAQGQMIYCTDHVCSPMFASGTLVGTLVPNYTLQLDSPKMIFGFGVRPSTLDPTLLKINYPLYGQEKGVIMYDDMTYSLLVEMVLKRLNLAPNIKNNADVMKGGLENVMPNQEYVKQITQDPSEDDHFTSGPWLSVVVYLHAKGVMASGYLGDIKKYCKNGKLERVVGVIMSCTPNALGDLTVSLKDLSGTMGGTIHYKVFNEENGYLNMIEDFLLRKIALLDLPREGNPAIKLGCESECRCRTHGSWGERSSLVTGDCLSCSGYTSRGAVNVRVLGLGSLLIVWPGLAARLILYVIMSPQSSVSSVRAEDVTRLKSA
ncbi:hypothetical protein Tco_0982252 [Tanacetum coccineum]